MKVRNGIDGKWLLKQLLYKYVPREIAKRPKMGFDFPVAKWLRDKLKDWAENLIDKGRLKDKGYFDPELMQKKSRQHQNGIHDNLHSLWTILMFQAWLETNYN